MAPSREVFDQQRRPRFGTANPERMPMEFWEWMIRGEGDLQGDAASVFRDLGLIMRDGKLKGTYGPWRARDLFGLKTVREDGPIWTFERYGATRTELPDGRTICVGGEHEDWYDPDFSIYNDVVVLGPDGSLAIYGYPKEVFPPTDFHTANLVDGRIILIGGLGYPDDRRPGFTPVYRLDPTTYQITPIQTTGDAPGWISKHEAEVGTDGSIRVHGGTVVDLGDDGTSSFRNSFNEYRLDPATWDWTCTVVRNWSQFQIRRRDRRALVPKDDKHLIHLMGRDGVPHSVRKFSFEINDVVPADLLESVEMGESPRSARIGWEGAPVAIRVTMFEVQILIEGEVPPGRAAELAERIRANLEDVIGQPCRCRHLAGPA